MIHYFDRIIVNDEHKVIVQNGMLRPYTRYVAFWMGTPPSAEELEPEQCLDMSWSRMLAKAEAVSTNEEFSFEIVTRDGWEFTGRAMMSNSIEYHGKFVMSEYGYATVLEFKGEKHIDK